MMHSSSEATNYYFGNQSWLAGVLVVWIVLMVLSALSYRRSSMPWFSKVVAICLRGVGSGLLLGCLLEPMASYEIAKSQANSFALVLDTSRSAFENWNAQNPNRTANANSNWIDRNIRQEAEWSKTLKQNFKLRKFQIGSGLESVDSFEAVEFKGTDSAIIQSLDALRDRVPMARHSSEMTNGIADIVPLAGVLLISDGQATDREQLDRLNRYPVPIYPVILGKQGQRPDIAIVDVNSSSSDFETAPVTLHCTLEQRGFDNQEVSVELNEGTGKLIESKSVKLKASDQSTRVEFRFRPKVFGVQGYQISVKSVPDDNAGTHHATKEATLYNNKRFQIVERKRGPHRVLYISGRPNWEYKFLSRALHEDEEIELDSLIRIARKEAKFSFRDGSLESSNPLFSGFEDISDEEKEQIDEPVFVKINANDERQESKRFPESFDELFQYKTIILDDFDEELLNREEQVMLQQFVRTRGGGLILMGGTESMRGAKFNASPLAQLIPVYGDRSSNANHAASPAFVPSGSARSAEGTGLESDSKSSEFLTDINDVEVDQLRFNLTREGWLEPFMRVAESEEKERGRLQASPAIQVWNRIAGVKPGASVLAAGKRLDSDDGTHTQLGDQQTADVPLLVTQRFGKGRTAAFLVGDWWRWAMRREGAESPLLFQAWRQFVRWSITDVPEFAEFRNEAVAESTNARKLIVDLRNHLFEPLEDMDVDIVIQAPNGDKQSVKAEPVADMQGRYEALVLCKSEGIYTATARCYSDSDGIRKEEWNLETGWGHDPLVEEFQGMGENTELLAAIAEKSGGRLVHWDDLNQFATDLLTAEVPIKEKVVYPVWHQAWVLLLAVACLCVEWGWRRQYGMA